MLKNANFFFTFRAILIACILTISACSTQAPIKQTPNETSNAPGADVEIKEQDPESLISLARQAQNLKIASSYMLQAARIYFAKGLSSQSKATLKDVHAEKLPSPELRDFWRLSFDIAMLEQDIETLATATEQLRSTNYFSGSIEQQLETAIELEKAYALMEQPAKAALILIEQYRLIPEETLIFDLTSANPNESALSRSEKIWSYLKQSSPDELGALTSDIAVEELQGWILLTQTIQFQRNSLKNQHQSLNDWLSAWPNHSAAQALPKELQILQELPTKKAQEIILALPLSGTFGEVAKAIADGFMASYYEAADFSNETLSVRFFDTNVNDFFQLYEEPLDEKSVIIGPLEKNTLTRLTQMDSVPTQTIALNQVDVTVPTLNLFQFSLRPEQEASQIVKQLKEENKRRIAVLAPENVWGQRIEKNLISEIQSQGVLSSSSRYSSQKTLAKAVSRLLSTDKSTERARLIQDIAGVRLESTPRRRQDLDAIVMIANPEKARQLKPLLKYHYASDIPVYASSQINEADKGADNRDLNGIRFLDMPWVLNDESPVRNQIQTNLPGTAKRYDRFYAMGADAYALAPRIELLTKVDNSYIDGQTGKLYIDELNVVGRDLQWARFRNGKTIVQESD